MIPNSMDSFEKKIVLGVSGSIAAYKAGDIIRQLLRRQIKIKVVMTQDSHKFISATTLAALSRNPVSTDIFSPQPYGPVPHIDLARNMDLLLVAPATAHCLAKFAHGFANDLLSALFLATKAPVLMAPAMNPTMYAHPLVQSNIKNLRDIGVFFVDPIQGEVACGQHGKGHLALIDDICYRVEEILYPKQSFKNKTFLITAGPTREFIDPVRFLSNRSSGKMGFALASAAQKKGAQVILISGPTSLLPPEGVTVINVTTAEEMFNEAKKSFPNSNVVIMAAAVADFRPINKTELKIKKEEAPSNIQLEATPDILLELGRIKTKDQILIGFAAEDQNLIQNAREKLTRKNLDIIVANDISQPEVGFEVETNQVTIIDRSGETKPLPKGDKDYIAEKIILYLENLLKSGMK